MLSTPPMHLLTLLVVFALLHCMSELQSASLRQAPAGISAVAARGRHSHFHVKERSQVIHRQEIVAHVSNKYKQASEPVYVSSYWAYLIPCCTAEPPTIPSAVQRSRAPVLLTPTTSAFRSHPVAGIFTHLPRAEQRTAALRPK